MEKVRSACRKFPDLEWSGVLYYKADNMDKGIYQLELELIDFVPITVDTKAHTGFSYGTEHIEYAIEKDLMDYEFGDIHSHNTMEVFFSGTDNNDFAKNAEFYIYYLSIVVNNKGEICAKVGQIVEKKSIVTGATLGGSASKEVSTKSVIVLECQLISSEDTVFNNWLAKVERKPITPTISQSVYRADDWNGADWGYKEPKKFGGYGQQATLFDPSTLDKPSYQSKFSLANFICEVVLNNNNPDIKLTDALRDYDYEGIDLETMMDEYSDRVGKKLEIHEEIKIIEEIIERIERCNINTRAVKSLLKDIKTEVKTYGQE